MADGSMASNRLPHASQVERFRDDATRRAGFEIHFADAFEWLDSRDANSIHAVVTDPPYGLKEYSEVEQQKLRRGRGGVWRIPPSFDGCKRAPLPRFTVLDDNDRSALRSFFAEFARRAYRVLVPGGHILIATNPLLSHLVGDWPPVYKTHAFVVAYAPEGH